MASPAILQTEGLSKRYRLGSGTQAGAYRYRTFREAIVEAASAPLRRLAPSPRRPGPPLRGGVPPSPSDLWALKGVSFSVAPGETLGVIGRNGAGKSTLLKILSGITQPTSGQARVHGRVASLLEVGTGFHPELTGRENVFLNGAVLGMTRREIRQKFDEIVAFAEVEPFIDTPVKRYSSGMQMRLAFSVAAHLEPEILLVDEVLAVGDTEFQKKCLGKMEDVTTQQGRTVLFVSHNLHAVASLCQNVLLLHRGEIREHGPTRQVVEQYLSSDAKEEAERVWPGEAAPGDETVRLHAVRVRARENMIRYDLNTSEAFSLEIEFRCLRRTRVTPSFHLFNSHGLMLFTTANLHEPEWGDRVYEPGLYRCSCAVPAFLLNEGHYHISAFLSRASDGFAHAHAPTAISFRVIDDGSGRGAYVGPWPGLIRPLLPWAGSELPEQERSDP